MSMTFSDDTPEDVFSRLNDDSTIILTSPLAQSLNATVGDIVKVRYIDYEDKTVEVEVPAGTYLSPGMPAPEPIQYHVTVPVLAWKNYTVVGVAQGAWLDIMSFGNFMLSEASYISYNNLNATFPNTNKNYNDTANLFFVKVNPNTNIEQTKNNLIQDYGDQYKLSITTYDDAVNRVRSSIDEIFYILYAIVIFAVANAGIGVAAIMIMNVSERKREIGILRSQGMSKTQVVTSIIGEATFLGVVGFVMGIIVGLMFHRVTVSYMRLEGFPMAFIMPYEAMAVILVLAVATAVISSVYPADKASKLDIVDAIRH
jgi:ABC-type antimicrobial peptide transport system permease subunit